MEILLTDGAQYGKASESGFPTTYTGYVIDSSDEAISTKTAQFSQEAKDDDSDGTYTLTEVAAPNGYNKLSSAVTIMIADGVIETATNSDGTDSSRVVSVDKDATNLVITVKNTSGSTLPETGGSGTPPFRLAGLLLMSESGYLIYDTLKRRRIYAS